MAGVNDRKFDVKDILDKATTGWVAPPNKPTLIVEDRQTELGLYLENCPDNGAIVIRKNYTCTCEKLSPTYENRVWEFPIVIIGQSNILLQGIFDQAREVFDRYTSAPWSTSTLGTSTTYSFAKIERAEGDSRIAKYVMDGTVYLAEYIAAVVIA